MELTATSTCVLYNVNSLYSLLCYHYSSEVYLLTKRNIFEFNVRSAVPVIRDIYNKLFMSLLWLNQQVYWFWCIAGHRQGDELNATLFALFIDEIKQRRPTSPSSQTAVRRDLSCLVDGSLEDRIIINIFAAICYTICTTTQYPCTQMKIISHQNSCEI